MPINANINTVAKSPCQTMQMSATIEIVTAVLMNTLYTPLVRIAI